jgi:glutaminyl-tRNA synthetase
MVYSSAFFLLFGLIFALIWLTKRMTVSLNPIVSTNFLKHIIEADLSTQRFDTKHWAGHPGLASMQQTGALDTAKIRTRFPPEPNGFLHIGHAKSICLNFGLAREYGGVCHLRFDDTNPEKEDQTYVDAIIDAVQWLGFDWQNSQGSHKYFASDYFDVMFECAVAMIKSGDAYVDEQTPTQMREMRGTLTEPGKNSPWRDRPISESLAQFHAMRAGQLPDGAMALRAKVDMASPNMNMRDPVMYRIRHATHHRTGDKWCIYPLYTWAHPVEDALEGITHSICTLEFEDQRPFYDWTLQKLTKLGFFTEPLPKQYEFARLNISYVITSKRKLLQLVVENHVNGWDDPRMPTIAGLRRRGYTPGAVRLFCERTGVSKSNSRIDYSLLDQALREEQDPIAIRSVAILHPLKLLITNLATDEAVLCHAPMNPHDSAVGQRSFPFTKELLIEQDDFAEVPPPKYFRLSPGQLVRLKYAYVVKCTGCIKDEQGRVTEVHAEYLPDTRSGTEGSNAVKVKGNITWVSAKHAVAAQFNLYDRLFTEPFPDQADGHLVESLNPKSIEVVNGWLEPGTPLDQGLLQFERLGYFVADRVDSTAAKPILNRVTTLKDTWAVSAT